MTPWSTVNPFPVVSGGGFGRWGRDSIGDPFDVHFNLNERCGDGSEESAEIDLSRHSGHHQSCEYIYSCQKTVIFCTKQLENSKFYY